MYCLHINQGFASTTPQTLACPILLTKFEMVLKIKGSLTGMILIDFQKAFDITDHSILSEKNELPRFC